MGGGVGGGKKEKTGGKITKKEKRKNHTSHPVRGTTLSYLGVTKLAGFRINPGRFVNGSVSETYFRRLKSLSVRV